MKKIIILFLVLSFAFSYTFNAEVKGETLTLDTDVTIESNIYISAPENMVLSGNPINLQDGDKICDGFVSVSPIASGRWAQDHFTGYSLYYEEPVPFVNAPSVSWHFIEWIDDYNFTETTDLRETDDNFRIYFNDRHDYIHSVYDDLLTSATGEPFSYRRLIYEAGFPYTGLGYSNVVCKSDYTVSANPGNSITQEVSSMDIVSMYAAPGTVTFSGQFSNGQCIAAMQLPFDANDDNHRYNAILLYRRNIMPIPSSTSAPITLTVVDHPSFAFSYDSIMNGTMSSLFLLGSAPPYTFSATEQTEFITVHVTNNGDISGIVTGADISPGMFSLSGPYVFGGFSTGWRSVQPTDVLAPGQSRDYGFLVAYDGTSDISNINSVTITMHFQASEEKCGETPTFDLPVPIAINGGAEDYYCEIIPNQRIDLIVNQTYNFNLTCYNISSGQQIHYTATINDITLIPSTWTDQWVVTNFKGPTKGNPTGVITIIPKSIGCGDLNATATVLSYPRTAGAWVCAIPEDETCVLTCTDCADGVPANNPVTVDITCFEYGSIVDCPTVAWQASGGIIDQGYDTHAVVIPSESSNYLNVIATPESYSDSCTLGNVDILQNKSCTVNLAQLYPEGFGTFKYNLTCREGNSIIDCDDVANDLNNLGGWVWRIEIEDLLESAHYTYDHYGTESDLKIFNYLDVFETNNENAKDLYVEASIHSNNPDFEDVECELDTKLPNLICEIFI